MTHLYISASLICGGVFRGKGFHSIPVPYSDIPEASEDQWNSGEYESLLVSPPDGWSVIFGCRESGHLGTYGVNDVGEGVLERSNRASFHNETNCFSVKLQCARVDCKAPATLHVNLKDGEAEKDLLRLLKAAFFDGLLPCGHPIVPIPDRYYVDPHRVLSRTLVVGSWGKEDTDVCPVSVLLLQALSRETSLPLFHP